MGWCGGHLHEFIIGGQNDGTPDPDFPGGLQYKTGTGSIWVALKKRIFLYV
jgi:hypothetical protein